MSEPLPDISLEELRANNPQAWEVAQRILWEKMWRAVHRKIPLATEAELTDLVSELLCDPVVAQLFEPTSDAFRKVKSFSDLVNLACHIAGLRAIDRIRQNVRRGEHASVDAVPEREIQEALDPGRKETDQADLVQFGLTRVDERYREVLMDHYFADLSTLEIAEKRGKPKNTILSHLNRGRAQLRDILEQEGMSIPAPASSS